MRFFRPLDSIKAISFDLDDTLYDNHPIIMRAEKGLKDYLAEHYPNAANYDRQALMKIKKSVIAKDDRLASDMGELRRQVLLQILKDDVDRSALETTADQCFQVFYRLRSEIVINKTVHSCLSQLKTKVPLVAITNGNMDTETTGMSQHFEFVLHASLQYARKPFPDMFDETVKRLGIEPKHILHVGDGLRNDVFGGYKAGFSTAWLAVNRPMNLNNEKVKVLPNIQLDSLEELLQLV